MTPEAFRSKAEEPGLPMQAARLVAFGAFPTRVDASADGEILIPIEGGLNSVRVPMRKVPGRTWLVLPTTLKEYTLLVGNRTVTIQVPEDFEFEWAVRDAFFPNAQPSHDPGHVDLARAYARQADKTTVEIGGQRVAVLRTGKFVKAGERAMAFDILTGDNLLVDRMSYHFVRPSVGNGFVFRTDNIHSPDMRDQNGQQVESYYIKRLVGVPGDTLEVRDFTLYRNGAPITGSDAFGRNSRRDGNYSGYRNDRNLEGGKSVTIPPREYFAMGDNSANSADSRYWGTVPAKDVVGRPIAVYFPFTRHWGSAR